MTAGVFQLIDIKSNFAYEFPFFPENITITERANWNPQEVTQGVKPLFYANTEPTRISIREIYLDETQTGISLKPDLDLLRLFKTELEEGGPPPPMLAMWGDERLRCVMTDLLIEQILFDANGNCTRARLAIELLELQPDGESTTVDIGI